MPPSRAKRITVIGAGPAGLAAASRLLERKGVEVRVLHMGHHLGGKAASYLDGHGRQVDHGWHMLLGFYARMKALMHRAGVDFDKTFSTMQGKSHCYEPRDGKLHPLSSEGGDLRVALRFAGYDGMAKADHLNLSRFMAHAFSVARADPRLQAHDDICFDAWARDHGLRPHLTRSGLFRVLREAYFNFPEPMSAYHALRTMKEMSSSSSAEAFVCVGPMSDLVWQPIADHIERRGGQISPYTLVTDWVYRGRQMVGLRTARPDPVGHDYGKQAWGSAAIPVESGSQGVFDEADVYISTIPAAVFAKMNSDDERMWASPFFERIAHMRSVSTVSMRVVTKRKVPAVTGPIFGIRAPLGNAFRMTPHLTAFHGIDGDVIDFVGQEPGFESWSDEAVRDLALSELSKALDMKLDVSGLESWELHRNRADHERLLLCEPGIQSLRPGPRTPFKNLFLAGDWIRNDVDLICMEGAICSGERAADLALEYLEKAGAA